MCVPVNAHTLSRSTWCFSNECWAVLHSSNSVYSRAIVLIVVLFSPFDAYKGHWARCNAWLTLLVELSFISECTNYDSDGALCHKTKPRKCTHSHFHDYFRSLLTITIKCTTVYNVYAAIQVTYTTVTIYFCICLIYNLMVGFCFEQIKNKNQGKIIILLHMYIEQQGLIYIHMKRTANGEFCNGNATY